MYPHFILYKYEEGLKMNNLFKMEFKNCINRKEFKFIFSVLVILVVAHVNLEINMYTNEVKNCSELLSAADSSIINTVYKLPLFDLISIILPLTVSIIYSDSYYNDVKSGVYKNIVTRCNRNKYIIAKTMVVFIISFSLVLLIQILDQIVLLGFFPIDSLNSWDAGATYERIIELHNGNALFESIRINQPYLNNFIYFSIRSMFAGAFAVLSYSISFIYSKNKYIILMSSFLMFMCYELFSEIISYVCRETMEMKIRIGIINNFFTPNTEVKLYYIFIIFCFILFISYIFIKKGLKKVI